MYQSLLNTYVFNSKKATNIISRNQANLHQKNYSLVFPVMQDPPKPIDHNKQNETQKKIIIKRPIHNKNVSIVHIMSRNHPAIPTLQNYNTLKPSFPTINKKDSLPNTLNISVSYTHLTLPTKRIV